LTWITSNDLTLYVLNKNDESYSEVTVVGWGHTERDTEGAMEGCPSFQILVYEFELTKRI